MTEASFEAVRMAPQQRRLWSCEGGDTQREVVVRVRGELRPEELQAAVARVVARHDILSTTLRQVPGIRFPMQVAADVGQLEARLAPGAPGEHLLTLHVPALLADAASLDVLVAEVAAAYARPPGEEEEDAASMPYGQFAEWQNSLWEDEDTEEGRSYWRERELFEPLRFTWPFEDEGHDTPQRAVERVVLDADLVSALASFAEASGTPTEALLLAVWGILSARFTDRRAVTIGTLFAGRDFEPLEQAIGLFARYVPITVQMPKGANLGEVAQAIAEEMEASDEWKELFDPDQDLGAEGSGAVVHWPLGFEYRALREEVFSSADGTSFALLERRGDSDVLRLKLTVEEGAAATSLLFEYDASRLAAADIQRLASCFEVLLSSFLATPETPATSLALLDAATEKRLIEGGRGPLCDPSRAVHQLFEEQAARQRRATALVFEDHSLSYGELEERANQLARHLRRLGLRREAPVALHFERSVEMAVALLATLKAGATYVPLDPSQPRERLATIFADAAPQAVLTTENLLKTLPPIDGPVLALDRDRARFAAESGVRLDLAIDDQQLAYVLFTSGSTGTPKGVAVSHGALANYARGVVEAAGLPKGGSYATVSTFAADLGNTSVFAALTTGGCLHVVSHQRLSDPEAMAEFGARQAIDVLKIVPSHLDALLSGARQGSVLPRRCLVLGGEALRWELVERVRALAPTCRVVNHYGPTEATVGILAGEVASTRGSTASVPLGRPLANNRVHVLDLELRPVAETLRGQLFLGGRGLARGYLGRPAQTAECFLPDPLSTEPGARLYRSGDLARALPGAGVEFLGRRDHQVKLRGYRIELGEVEAAVVAHPAVRECVVELLHDEAGEALLAAYFVPLAEAPSGRTLRHDLAARLPGYMMPTFVPLAALPLSPNGKVDRRALPHPAAVAGEAAETYVAPRTPVEEIVAEIWQEVLDRQRISVHDDFFDLGGHSLLATRVVSRLQKAFAVELPLRIVFEARTLVQLAERLEARRRSDEGAPPPPPLVAVPRGDEPPLSFQQQRLWFLDRLLPGESVYAVPHGLRLGGRLVRPALERALGEIVRRHEILRTCFPEVEGRPKVLISTQAVLDLPLEDLSALPPADRERELRLLAQAEGRRAFDLATGPLLRARLLRLGEEDHALLLTFHHIISDGWSLGVLLQELDTLYDTFAERLDAPSPLAELALQYADYAVWQRRWLEGEELARQLAWWKEQFSGAPPALSLPTDRPRPALQTFSGRAETLHFNTAQTSALKRLSRSLDASLFMTLMASFAVLLSRSSGALDLTLGTPIANRRQREVEPLIGFFVNTLALRFDLAGEPTFAELVARVRERALDAYSHQDLPFEQLVDELGIGRDLSRNPLVQVSFVFQKFEPPKHLGDLTLDSVGAGFESVRFDLETFVWEVENELHLRWMYNTDLFDRSTVRRMAQQFQTLLAGLEETAGTPLGRLPLLSAAATHQLRHEWNDTAAPRPCEAVHQLIDAALNGSEGTAVLCGERRLTHRQLVVASDRLGRYLRSLGVGRGSLVGVCSGRTPELVVGLLGVLKAGAAYLPLDPSSPPERLTFQLADAAVELVLTEETLAAGLPLGDRRVLLLGEEPPATTVPLPTVPLPTVCGEDLAYVIYTSGSTGRPKGTRIHHQGLVNYLHWAVEAYEMVAGEGAPVHSSLGFDATVTSLLAPLLVGRTVVLVAEGEELESLAETLRTGREFSLLKLTPAHLAPLAQLLGDGADLLRTARTLVLGGEALRQDQLDFWQRAAPRMRVFNEYGPTEAVVGCCVHEASDRGTASGAVAIGRPIANTRLHVVDRGLGEMALGVEGELVIGGLGLARDYLGRPALTAEKFVPDPFAGEPGSRLYRSGDRVRYLCTGEIEYLGRFDHQIQVRGLRVEPGEVEAAVVAQPEVREALVVLREDPSGAGHLVAYVVTAADAKPTVSELRRRLGRRLSESMVPSAFVFLDALPLNSSGKVARDRLPDPESTRPQLDTAYQAPRTAIEQTLAALWCQVLGLEEVGVHDNFFDVGGHSLRLVEVASALAPQLGRPVRLVELFQHPTIRSLARHLSAVDAAGDAPDGARLEDGQQRAGARRESMRRLAGRRRRPLKNGGASS